MIITILKRYDINGAWTHDIEAKIGNYKSKENSMWKVYKIIDLKEMEENIEYLELECEDLTEKNRLLIIRITELIKKGKL